MYVFRRRDAVNHSRVFLQEMRPHTISPSQQKQYPELFASRRNKCVSVTKQFEIFNNSFVFGKKCVDLYFTSFILNFFYNTIYLILQTSSCISLTFKFLYLYIECEIKFYKISNIIHNFLKKDNLSFHRVLPYNSN